MKRQLIIIFVGSFIFIAMIAYGVNLEMERRANLIKIVTEMKELTASAIVLVNKNIEKMKVECAKKYMRASPLCKE